MKKITVLVMSLLFSTIALARTDIAPSVLADAKIQAVLNSYVDNSSNLISVGFTRPSDGILKIKVVYGFKMGTYTVCHFATMSDDKTVQSVSDEGDCD